MNKSITDADDVKFDNERMALVYLENGKLVIEGKKYVLFSILEYIRKNRNDVLSELFDVTAWPKGDRNERIRH